MSTQMINEVVALMDAGIAPAALFLQPEQAVFITRGPDTIALERSSAPHEAPEWIAHDTEGSLITRGSDLQQCAEDITDWWCKASTTTPPGEIA